jgi:hypothetical protein
MLNTANVVYNYWWLLESGKHRRNFSKDLNFSRLLVAIIEAYYVLWNVAAVVWAYVLGSSSRVPVKVIAERLSVAASFSCLKVLSALDAKEIANKMATRAAGAQLLMLGRLFFFGLAGVLSLVIKSESLDVFKKGDADLGLDTVVMVIFFVNQVTGLFDKDRYAIRTILSGMGEEPTNWMEGLAEHLKKAAQDPTKNDGHITRKGMWRAVGYYANITYKQVFALHTLQDHTYQARSQLPCGGELRRRFDAACTKLSNQEMEELRRKNSKHISLICGDVEHPGEFE